MAPAGTCCLYLIVGIEWWAYRIKLRSINPCGWPDIEDELRSDIGV
jgi:hypothetical protein